MRSVVMVASGMGLLAVALAAARSGRAPAAVPDVVPPANPQERSLPAAPVVPEGLRDVFRFADRPEAPAPESPKFLLDEPAAAAAMPPGPRLVGLVRRAGRTVAALALDGEVVLAGPGESVSGVTVVEIGDESVRIRSEDGDESTLVLP